MAALFAASTRFLLFGSLTLRRKCRNLKKDKRGAKQGSPLHTLFFKWGGEHLENWPEDKSVVCQSRGIRIYFSLH